MTIRDRLVAVAFAIVAVLLIGLILTNGYGLGSDTPCDITCQDDLDRQNGRIGSDPR